MQIVEVCPIDISGCLADGFPSPEAVGRTVIDALNEGQSEKLHRCRVTREEYLSCLWKRFPASAHMPGDFAYANLEKKCRKGVNRWVQRWGKRALVFNGIRFTQPSEGYHDFILHRGTVLSATTPDGMTVGLPILGSIVEMQGRFKLLSYDDG